MPRNELWVAVPELRGLRFVGGLAIKPEFSALLVGITVFGGAYVGEIVRGGLLSVERGKIEARAMRMQLDAAAVRPSAVERYETADARPRLAAHRGELRFVVRLVLEGSRPRVCSTRVEGIHHVPHQQHQSRRHASN